MHIYTAKYSNARYHHEDGRVGLGVVKEYQSFKILGKNMHIFYFVTSL
jgi:hypothetical protein